MLRVKPVLYTRNALKDLRKHGNMQARIRRAVEEYAADGMAHSNNVTDLVGDDGRRLRVGDFRVLFKETDTAITVTRVAPRGEVYD